MRVLATAAFSFSAGIFLAQYLLPYAWQLPLCLCCVLVGVAAFLFKGDFRLRAALISFGTALAMLYNWGYVLVVQTPAEKLAGTNVSQLSMTLVDYAIPTDYGAKVTVRPAIEGLRGVKVVYYGDAALLELGPGSIVTDDVKLNSAARIRDDDITTFTSKGVFLLAYSRGDPVYDSAGAGAFDWLPQRAARVIQDRIAEMFSGDTAGFLSAILTGDKSGISEEAAVTLSEASLYHILAVSGMHCAYLLGMVTLFVGSHRRRLQALIAIPVLLFYMFLTGCSPSVVRACIMILFVLAASLFLRENDMPTSMSAALALILFQNPFAAASISLQLSFAAIGGIIWAAPAIQKLFPQPKGRRMVKFLLYSVTVSLGVTVCTAPLSAYYFNTLSLIAPLSNLLCLWAAGIVFTCGLLAVLLSLIWMPLGMILGFLPKILIGYLLWMAELLASVPYHAVYFSNPYLKYWLLFAYGLFLLCWLLKPKAVRKYAVAGVLCAVSLAVTVWLGSIRYTYGALNITMLDVGQGASIIVSSKESFGLIDCGSRNSWYSAGQIAADALLSMGCHQLDYLMLTHYDSDPISGVRELLTRLTVKQIILPDSVDDSGLRLVVESLAEFHHIPVTYVTSKVEYPLGEATITVYPPVGKEGDNQLGLTYLCTAGDYDLLVTGDMDTATEKLLLKNWQLPDIEALAVGHHGSASSTSTELLKALRPEMALISVGDNSYGHPANQTLRRLLVSDAEIFRTDLQGNIHITVN